MEQKTVIIIGGGFGGLMAARELEPSDWRVIVVDRLNHHLFQPLLYQVATAGLSPANIAQPLRYLLRDDKNLEVYWSEVTGIDTTARTITTPEGSFSYDFLIVAAGARHSYFGHPEWEQFAPGLKTLDDAVEIRRRILTAFEMAEKASTPEERQACLTFVVVGGGPTGVEMSGAIAEVAHQSLDRDFRRIHPSEAKILLIDASDRVLSSFAEELSMAAADALGDLGVNVLTKTKVENVDATGVNIPGQRIESRTVIWAAGNAASPLGKMLGVPTDKAGRVVLQDDLTIPGHPEVFVIGDMASLAGKNGHPLPGVSQVAMQMGRHAARTIMTGKHAAFKYFDKGSMATIGRNLAVADLHFIKLTGFLAWMAWALVHLVYMVGLRNKVLVFTQWIYSYCTFGKAARLITGNFKTGLK